MDQHKGNTEPYDSALCQAILSGNPSFTMFVAAKTSGTQAEKMLHFGNSAGTPGQVLGMAKNGGYYFNGGGELTFSSVNFGGNVQVGVFRRKASATYAEGEFFFNGTTQIGSAQSGTSVPAIPSLEPGNSYRCGSHIHRFTRQSIGNAVMHEVMLFSGDLLTLRPQNGGLFGPQMGIQCKSGRRASLQIKPPTVWWLADHLGQPNQHPN